MEVRREQRMSELYRCSNSSASGVINFQFKVQMQACDRRALKVLLSHDIDRRQLSEQRTAGHHTENSDTLCSSRKTGSSSNLQLWPGVHKVDWREVKFSGATSCKYQCLR